MDSYINEGVIPHLETGSAAKATTLSLIPEGTPAHSLVFRTAASVEISGAGGTRGTKFCVINSQDGLAEMVQTMVSNQGTPLYLAVEASLLVLHVHTEPGYSFILDLESLGASAFEPCEASNEASNAASNAAAQEAAGEAGLEQTERQGETGLPSLKAILESKDPSMPKILFDCRQACAFLAGRFGINMGLVEDIQCLEIEGRPPGQTDEQKALRGKRQWVVNNNAKDQDGVILDGAAGWDTKTRARPLPIEVALYCVEQVRHLPGLRERYLGRLDEDGLEAARLRTESSLGEADAESEFEGVEAFLSHGGLWINH